MVDTKKNPEQKQARRSEKAGILNFSREMISALGMAFIAIVYIIQAFKIPTGSMENSLLTGDFLLGLKFVYGAPVLPFSYTKLPGFTKPKPGDVVIFRYPGSDAKDYIKRCVAGPGQTIEIKQKEVYVDGKTLKLAPRGKYIYNGILYPEITDYPKLRIPAKGDTIYPETLPVREFLFAKHLIHQENPLLSISYRVQNTPVIRNLFPYKRGNERVTMKFSAYVNDEFQYYSNIPSHLDNWLYLDGALQQLEANLRREYLPAYDSLKDSVDYQPPKIEIKKDIFLDGKRITSYVVKNNNYFMMGDNRDNSADSRYWGYLNFNFIKAKAFILYFSWAQGYEQANGELKLFNQSRGRYSDGTAATMQDDPDKLSQLFRELQEKNLQWYWNEKNELIAGRPKRIPGLLIPLKIRWSRIGKLIRSWDGGLQNN